MTIRARLRAVEKRCGMHERKALVVFWPCSDIDATKARVTKARRRGWTVRVIRFVPMDAEDECATGVGSKPPRWLVGSVGGEA